MNQIQIRNSAQHFDRISMSRQWPRFPALPKNHVPDDDILFSVIFFWFVAKGWFVHNSTPPTKDWA